MANGAAVDSNDQANGTAVDSNGQANGTAVDSNNQGTAVDSNDQANGTAVDSNNQGTAVDSNEGFRELELRVSTITLAPAHHSSIAPTHPSTKKSSSCTMFGCFNDCRILACARVIERLSDRWPTWTTRSGPNAPYSPRSGATA